MENKLILHLDFLTPGLNGSDGLIRQHFGAAAKMKLRIRLLFRSQIKPPFAAIKVPVRITYIRYTSSLMDWDNACASFKHIGDALQEAGILSDDSPKIVAVFDPKQEKVKRTEQRTEIIIEPI